MRSKIVPKEAVPTLETDGCITYEEGLPFPIVHYPSSWCSFFGFQETEDSPVCYCSCQRKGLEIYLLNEEFGRFGEIPKSLRFQLGETFIDTLQFKDNFYAMYVTRFAQTMATGEHLRELNSIQYMVIIYTR